MRVDTSSGALLSSSMVVSCNVHPVDVQTEDCLLFEHLQESEKMCIVSWAVYILV